MSEETAPQADLDAARKKIAQLEVGLEHRGVISAAVGMLMERYKLDYDPAFNTLCRISSEHNVKVYDLAQELLMKRRVHGL